VVGKPEGRDHVEDSNMEGRTGLRTIFRKWGCLDMDWVDLARDMDRCWALVNVEMNFRVP